MRCDDKIWNLRQLIEECDLNRKVILIKLGLEYWLKTFVMKTYQRRPKTDLKSIEKFASQNFINKSSCACFVQTKCN